MKKFLSKKEACVALNEIDNLNMLPRKESVEITSIKVCLAEEDMGFDLWGKFVEDAKPIFKNCEIPTEDSSGDVIENYKVYQASLKEAKEKIMGGSEVNG